MNQSVKELLSQHLSSDQKMNISEAISKAYKISNKIIRDNKALYWEESIDLLPYIRRVVVDYYLRELSAKWNDCYFAVGLNNAHNCRHIKLFKGPFVITAHQIEPGQKLPRKALFRSALAQSNLDLFENDPSPINRSNVYINVVHSGHSQPEIVRLVIPSSNNTYSLYSEDIPLVKFETVQTENVPDNLKVQLKDLGKKVGNEG